MSAKRWAHIARGALLPFVVVAAWELLARGGLLADGTFSRPSHVAVAMLRGVLDGSLARMTVETLSGAGVGWAIGSMLGIAGGVLIGLVPRLRDTVGLAVELLRPVPPVALIPVALLIFGLGPQLDVGVVAFAVFWPVLVMTAAGVRSVDARFLEVARSLRFAAAQRVLLFVLPAAAPRIAVGLRVGAGIALVIAVTTEIIANPRGLGYGVTMASISLQPDVMFADLLWLGVVGVALNAIFEAIERRTFRWTRW
jgi:NitT/TauT family transport system permease protein